MKFEVCIMPPQVIIDATVSETEISVGNSITREYINLDPYEGSYKITPSDTEQILQTNNLRMTNDIIVEQIPSNYGLITWNGTVLLVS